MRMTEKDQEKPKQKLDYWDELLNSYSPRGKTEPLVEKKKRVVSFRVTDNEYKKVVERFGNPSGVREVVLSELEEIEIEESGGDVLGLDE